MPEGDEPTRPEEAPSSTPVGPESVRSVRNASADRYRALIEAADDAILVAHLESTRVLEANRAACELLGYRLEEFVDLPARRLHLEDDPDVDAVFRDLAGRQSVWHPGLRTRRKDGTTFWSELRANRFESGHQTLVLFILRDVTHRVEREAELGRAYQSLKDAQARLVHAGKLAAIGQIAGGVAHEVSNPATFILANLRLMRDSVAYLRGSASRLRRSLVDLDGLPPEAQAVARTLLADGEIEAVLREMNDMVEDNLAGIERIASIVNDLRVFSRIEHDEPQPVRINDVVDVACNLAYADIRHRARLVKEQRRVPLVQAEPGKLAQVFTNLLVNAAHSIEEGAANENEIRVSTYQRGSSVFVAVQDTGREIPEGVREHIFDPLFSTQYRDRWTGVGLSLAAEIVELHGGRLHLASTSERGNRFEVELPAEPTAAPEPPMEPAPPSARPPAPPRRARVLVIDDDLAVLRAYRRMLSSRHDVVLASGGAEGLSVLEQDRAFDLILCDVMMPQVDGPMVYDALVSRAPDVVERLLFCTGGAFTPRAKQFLGSVPNAFLQKPVDAELLHAAIEKARRVRA